MMEELGTFVFGNRPESTKSARSGSHQRLCSTPRSIRESQSAPNPKGWLEISSSDDSSVFSGLSPQPSREGDRSGQTHEVSSSEMDTTRDESGESSGEEHCEESRDSFSASRDDTSSADDDDYDARSSDSESGSEDESSFIDRDSAFGGESAYSAYTDYDSLIECTQEKPGPKSQLKLVASVQIDSNNNEARIAAMLEEHEFRMNKDLATVSVAKQSHEERDDHGEEIEICEEFSRRIESQEIALLESRDTAPEPEDEVAVKPQLQESGKTISEDEASVESDDSEDDEASVDSESEDGVSEGSEGHVEDASESHISTSLENDFPSGYEEHVSTKYIDNPTESEHQESTKPEDCASVETDDHVPDEKNDSAPVESENRIFSTPTKTASFQPDDSVSDELVDKATAEDKTTLTGIDNGPVYSSEDEVPSMLSEEAPNRSEEAQDEPEDPVLDSPEDQRKVLISKDSNEDQGQPIYENISPVGSDDVYSSGSASMKTARSDGKTPHISEASAEKLKVNTQEDESLQGTYESMSAFGQAEEEQDSDSECTEQENNEERAELGRMSLTEIEALIKEKDVAVNEARWQAKRYAELGREQIASLKRQLEEVKEQNADMIKAAVQEAFSLSAELAKEQKDQEIQEIVSSVRQVYNDKIERLESESEFRVKAAAIDANNETTQRLTDTISTLTKRLEAERNGALQAESKRRIHFKKAIEESNHTIDKLTQERNSIVQILEVAKGKLCEHHAGIVEQVQGSRISWNSKYFEYDVDQVSSTDAKLLVEVLQCHGILLESFDKHMEESETRHQKEIEQVQKEQNDLYIKLKVQLEAHHQEEIDQMKEHTREANDRVQRLEADLNSTGQEKKSQEGIYREALENGKKEAERLRAEKTSQEEMYRAALETFRGEAEGLRAEREAQDDTHRKSLENFQKETERLRIEKKAQEEKLRQSVESHRCETERLRAEQATQEQFYNDAIENYRGETERLRAEKESLLAKHRQTVETSRLEVEQLRADKKAEEEKYYKAVEDFRTQAEIMREAANEAGLQMSHKLNSAASVTAMEQSETFDTQSVSSQSTSSTKTAEGSVRDIPPKPVAKPTIAKLNSDLPLLKTFRPPPISTPQNWVEPEGEAKNELPKRSSPPPSPRFRSVRSFFENSRAVHAFGDGSADCAEGPSTPRGTSPRHRRTSSEGSAFLTGNGSTSNGPDLQKSASTEGDTVPSTQITPTIRLRKSWLPEKKVVAPIDGHKGSSTENLVPDQSGASWKLRKPPLPSAVTGTVGKHLLQGQGADGKKPPLGRHGHEKVRSSTVPKEPTPLEVGATETARSEGNPSSDAYLRHAKQQLLSPASKALRPQPELIPKSKPLPSTVNDTVKNNQLNPKIPNCDSVVTSAASDESETGVSPPPVSVSGVDSQDDSCQSSGSPFEPVQFSNSFPAPKTGIKSNNRAPIVLSRTVDDCPLISIDSMEENRPSVVRGQPIFRQPSLSAFAPPKDVAQSTSNNTNGSCTSQTAPKLVKSHSFKSMQKSGRGSETPRTTPSPGTRRARSSSVEPKRNLLAHARKDNTRSGTSSSDTARRAANFASLRTRRLAARRGS